MKTMKSSVLLVAAVFALSTSALAESTLPSKAVQMNDVQLDQITAAGAASGVLLANPGNSNGSKGSFNLAISGHSTCVNCDLLADMPREKRATGVVVVVNRGHPINAPLMRCIGSGFGLPVC